MAGTPFLLGWEVPVWAGLDALGPIRTASWLRMLGCPMNRYQSLILAELYVYFTLREAFEWAELQLLQFEGAEVAVLEGLTN